MKHRYVICLSVEAETQTIGFKFLNRAQSLDKETIRMGMQDRLEQTAPSDFDKWHV